MEMDKREMLIISALRQNCRQSLTDMSKETRIPISTIHERINCYDRTLIKKHTALIDFAKLGFNTRAKVLVKVDREQRKKLQEFLKTCKNVNTLLKVNNGFDFLADMIFPHIKEMEDFVEGLEKKFRLINKEVFYVIDELKMEEFFADPSLVLLENEQDA
ncbi:MAG: Lrp/AsnC family transcriptional regulator [Candidatus Nanoarchaeia archaeon]|nr:Lrp/AsnC family transcriptional regulator [Candidatus Nanoarchaeia archaeon]